MGDLYKGIYSLYERPSFLEGIARLFDFSGFLNKQYNFSKSDRKADFRSLQSDWQFVGDDIRIAIKQYEKHLQ